MPETRTIDRPLPNDRAKLGLLHVESVEVTFSGGSDRDQEEALDYFNELIAFWNLKYIDWIPHDGPKKKPKPRNRSK